jgi:hypothetical protein
LTFDVIVFVVIYIRCNGIRSSGPSNKWTFDLVIHSRLVTFVLVVDRFTIQPKKKIFCLNFWYVLDFLASAFFWQNKNSDFIYTILSLIRKKAWIRELRFEFDRGENPKIGEVGNFSPKIISSALYNKNWRKNYW